MNIFVWWFITTFDVDYQEKNASINLFPLLAMKPHPMPLWNAGTASLIVTTIRSPTKFVKVIQNQLLGQKTLMLHWGNSFFESKKHFFDIRSKEKFLWIKESFVHSENFSLIQRNRFVHIKENLFESTKLSSIQRNFFFDRISKKLFSRCVQKLIMQDHHVTYCEIEATLGFSSTSTLRKKCYWINSISFQKHVYHGFKSICYRISNIFIGSCSIFLWIHSIHAFEKKCFWFNSIFFSV